MARAGCSSKWPTPSVGSLINAAKRQAPAVGRGARQHSNVAEDPIELSSDDADADDRHRRTRHAGKGDRTQWAGRGGQRSSRHVDHDDGAAGQDDDGDSGGRPGGGGPGFQTARDQLITDLRKKGQHDKASMFQVGLFGGLQHKE